MIKVYGKSNCPNCVKIKCRLENLDVVFEYIQDDNLINKIALELRDKGELKQMLAPIIITDEGKQLIHSDIDKLK